MKIAFDESILIKDEICTAGYKMLYNFKPPYSATVVDRIKQAGMTIVSKDGNPDVILENFVETKLNYPGYLYIKPTYGTVSRFGLTANVSSMDTIGVYAKNIDCGFEVLSVISGYDKNDGTTYPTEKYNYTPDVVDADKWFGWHKDFKYADSLEAVYMIISAAEFSNNISRFDGLKFGYRTENFKNVEDMIVNSRSESFDVETKIKALMGTYVLSEEQFEKYYLKATQIRRLIKQELDGIFKQYDYTTMPPDSFSRALINLTGYPAVVFGDKIIIAKEFGENKLFALGKSLLQGEG